MTPERWQQIRDLLHSVMQLPSADRPASLDLHCAGDAALRKEVEELLIGDHQALAGFLESPTLAQLTARSRPSADSTVLPAGTKLGPYVVQSDPVEAVSKTMVLFGRGLWARQFRADYSHWCALLKRRFSLNRR